MALTKWKVSSLLLGAVLSLLLFSSPALAHTVTLNWTASPDSTVKGYFVYRADSAGADNPAAPLNDPSSSGIAGTSYVDNTVVAGHTYFYYVESYDGTTDSVPSNEVKVVVPVTTPTGVTIIKSN